jgi:hypothetical protein
MNVQKVFNEECFVRSRTLSGMKRLIQDGHENTRELVHLKVDRNYTTKQWYTIGCPAFT